MQNSDTSNERTPSWGIFRDAGNLIRSYLGRLLHIRDENKVDIYRNVFGGAEFADLNYWLEIIFSIGIATLGLTTNSPAVVIGAMLISPLMGPIIANGMALALGDFYLGIKSSLSIILSIVASILLAALITWTVPFHSPTPEILARVQPSLLDLGIALLSGMAGAVVLCRGGRGGGINALPGVAVAVALMPPLGVVGFGVGSGWNWSIISGGGLLFLTNLVAIIFSSFLVFFSVRLDTPLARQQISSWLEEKESQERLYDIVRRTPLRRTLGRVGSLPRRLLILAIFLVTVAFPLQRTLARLRDEAQIRRVVLAELNKVVPRDAIVQQNTDVFPDRLAIRVVAVLPQDFLYENRAALERLIEARTSLPTRLTLINVATREELAEWTGRLATARPAVTESSIDELRQRLVQRVDPAVRAAWPVEQAPLLGFEIATRPDSPNLLIALTFLADTELGTLGQEVLRKSIADRVSSSAVEVRFIRIGSTHSVAFAAGSSDLDPQAQSQVEHVGALLRRYPLLRCALSVDSRNGERLLRFEQERADRVRSILEKDFSIDPRRLTAAPLEGRGSRVLLKLSAAP